MHANGDEHALSTLSMRPCSAAQPMLPITHRYRQPRRTHGETIALWAVRLGSEPKSMRSTDVTASPAKNRNMLLKCQPNAHAADQPT